MDRIFSGIQPSGEIHIGNYVGAIRNWVKLTDHYDCVYCVVDYHAITIEYEVELMQKRILETATILIGCGLTPDKCIVFVQSIRRGGRVHEATMLIDYKLRSRDFLTDLIPGMMLFTKGKIPLLPSLVKGRGEIKRIFERCTKEK